MNRSLLNAALMIVFALAAAPAAALNPVQILKGGPAEYFNERDLQLFIDTLHKAQDETKPGDPMQWENPETKSRGSITVLEVYESKGMPCKRLRIENQARGRKASGRYNICQVNGKDWKIAPAKKADPKAK